MERAISLSSSDMWWRAIIEGFGGEGRGGYIEMATLPNTAKWITPDNYSITRFLQHNQFPENFSSHLFMNPDREFRKSEPCVFFEGDYRYGFGCIGVQPTLRVPRLDYTIFGLTSGLTLAPRCIDRDGCTVLQYCIPFVLRCPVTSCIYPPEPSFRLCHSPIHFWISVFCLTSRNAQGNALLWKWGALIV